MISVRRAPALNQT